MDMALDDLVKEVSARGRAAKSGAGLTGGIQSRKANKKAATKARAAATKKAAPKKGGKAATPKKAPKKKAPAKKKPAAKKKKVRTPPSLCLSPRAREETPGTAAANGRRGGARGWADAGRSPT